MTPAKLPDTLARLSELVPERVWRVNWKLKIKLGSGWLDCYIETNTSGWEPVALGQVIVEAALREEINSRGWEWGIEGNANQATGTVWRQGDTPDHCHVATAPTPAHALACAMVAALSGEEEG